MAAFYKIATLGLWHLGEIYSSCLAELGHEVVGISDNEELIKNLKKNVPPLPEPELESLLAKNQLAGRLNFSTDFREAKSCNVVWITFDTPVNDQDEVDLSPIHAAASKVAPHLSNGCLVVVSSQIPVGESGKICEIIKRENPSLEFDYVYTPENLRLGSAVKSFQEPGRIIVGSETHGGLEKIKEIFSGLRTEFVEMNTASAEMAKHAINAFLATSVSFINDIADACEIAGADILDVSKALRSEPRIGPKAFLDAGLGFSGGTLGRDLQVLSDLGNLPVIESVYRKNDSRTDKVISKIKSELGGLEGKTISIFGLTYKPGTKTLRRSRALEISKIIRSKGAVVKLHDPEAEKEELAESEKTEFFTDPYLAAESADAIILVTPWPHFKTLNFSKIQKIVKPGAVFFDTANFLYDKEGEIKKNSLRYLGLGRK